MFHGRIPPLFTTLPLRSSIIGVSGAVGRRLGNPIGAPAAAAAAALHLFFFSSSSTSDNNKKDKLFLHVGPSGDCWTGTSIFAAKHLQPDYVKSVPLPANADGAFLDQLLERLEENPKLAQQVYDTNEIPPSLLSKLDEPSKD